MARFLTAPRRQMVNPYPEVNVDFYSNLMGQAQQNLNQATQMQSQALDYIYNLPVYSEEDRASVITPAEEKFKSMLDSEFISPSQVAGTIMDVRREIQPGVQALQAKSKAADMYDKLKVQYGVNALMGTDPRSLSIKTQEGSWRDPSQFEASGVNMEDIDKLFLQSQTSTLNKPGGISYIVGKGIDVNGVPEGVIQTVESKGLSEQERNKLYHPNSPYARQLAESQLQSIPELLDVTDGDKEKALQAIINRNWSTSGSYKRDVNYGSMRDPSYTKPETDTPGRLPAPGRSIEEPKEGVAIATQEELGSILNDVYGVQDNAMDIATNVKKFGASRYEDTPYYPMALRMEKQLKEQGYLKRQDKVLSELKNDPVYSEIYKGIESRLSKEFEGTELTPQQKEMAYTAEFLKEITPMETELRMLLSKQRVFNLTETPLFIDDILVASSDGTMPFRKINDDGTLGENLKSNKVLGSDSKLKPEFQQASIIINPYKGVIEMTSTKDSERYAVQEDKLDTKVKSLLHVTKDLSDKYIESIKKGSPDPKIALELESYTDLLYKAYYSTYTNEASDYDKGVKSEVNQIFNR